MNLLKKLFFKICTTCEPHNSRTVRFAFPLVFAVAAFLGAQAIVSTGETYISVEPSTNSLRASEPFYFNVYVNAHTAINAVDLELTFPTDQVKVTGIDVGESVITLWTVDPYFEGNKVYLRGGTFRRGFLGQHLIATVNAVAVETGIAEIKISDSLLLAGDGSGTKIEATASTEEVAKLYIANEDGSFDTNVFGSELSGTVKVEITTDIDGDGEVSLADVSRFMSAWFSKRVIYDFNSDGRMTFTDFGIILSDSFFK